MTVKGQLDQSRRLFLRAVGRPALTLNTRPPCSSPAARSPSKTRPSPAFTGRCSSIRTRPLRTSRTWPISTPRLAELGGRHEGLVIAAVQPADGETAGE